jgi:subtilisin family serine protease
MQLSPLARGRRPLSPRGWLLAVSVALLLGSINDWSAARPDPDGPAGAAQEATPESGVPASSVAPARQRAQLLARLGVDRWHTAGYRGQGVRVAILDSGFRGFRARLGMELPAQVITHSFRRDGDLEARDSQHGILCAEVIHALAPDAELLFLNWDADRPDQFLEALRWARAQGAKVVTCSLIMPSWSDGEGGGAVNDEVTRLLGDGKAVGDVLCFASAGNTAQRHWSGTFRPDGAGLHQWRRGQTNNSLKPWGTERVGVELYGRTGLPLTLSVFDATTGATIGSSEVRPLLPGSDGGCAVVRFLPQAHHDYQVQVRAAQGPRPGEAAPFHLSVLGAGLEHWTSRGSISCPADGPAVLAVGAVDDDGRRLFYSSCGPNSRRPKPDLVAEVPFPSLLRDRPFAGTSAASPQAAALAALWWSRHPDWTAERVRSAMLSSARDLGPPGHDWETGYGRINLP